MRKQRVRLDSRVIMEFQTLPHHLKLKCLDEVKSQVPFNIATFNALSYRKIYKIIKQFKKDNLCE